MTAATHRRTFIRIRTSVRTMNSRPWRYPLSCAGRVQLVANLLSPNSGMFVVRMATVWTMHGVLDIQAVVCNRRRPRRPLVVVTGWRSTYSVLPTRVGGGSWLDLLDFVCPVHSVVIDSNSTCTCTSFSTERDPCLQLSVAPGSTIVYVRTINALMVATGRLISQDVLINHHTIM